METQCAIYNRITKLRRLFYRESDDTRRQEIQDQIVFLATLLTPETKARTLRVQ